MTVEWSDPAIGDLEQIYEYLALSGGQELAKSIVERIFYAVEQLATFPQSGRPGRIHRTRELVISGTPYIAAYTIESELVTILASYHGAQRWPDVL